jgi:type VI secretion system protein ImpG
VPDLQVRREDVRLYCTPIVNLFSRKSEALSLSADRSEYRILPVDAEAGHLEVYSVEEVIGWERGTVERVSFPRFDAIVHGPSLEGDAVYYRTRSDASVVERRVDSWVSFVDAHAGHASLAMDTAVAELLCTNGDLPVQLGVGSVDQATVNSPPFARFRNITPIAPGAMPPIDAELPWRLLCQFSPNRHSLSDAETLRWVLASFDLRGLRDRQAARATERRLDGIRGVEVVLEDVFHRGVPARGTLVELVLDEEAFDGPGEMALLTRIVGELLPLYSTRNATVRWRARTGDGRLAWESPIRRGQQPIL